MLLFLRWEGGGGRGDTGRREVEGGGGVKEAGGGEAKGQLTESE